MRRFKNKKKGISFDVIEWRAIWDQVFITLNGRKQSPQTRPPTIKPRKIIRKINQEYRQSFLTIL